LLKNPIGRPEARIQIFSLTILGEAKHPQIQCLSLQGEFWICSEASLRIVEKNVLSCEGQLFQHPVRKQCERVKVRVNVSSSGTNGKE